MVIKNSMHGERFYLRDIIGYGSLGTNERGTSLSSLESKFGVISVSVSRDI